MLICHGTTLWKTGRESARNGTEMRENWGKTGGDVPLAFAAPNQGDVRGSARHLLAMPMGALDLVHLLREQTAIGGVAKACAHIDIGAH